MKETWNGAGSLIHISFRKGTGDLEGAPLKDPELSQENKELVKDIYKYSVAADLRGSPLRIFREDSELTIRSK